MQKQQNIGQWSFRNKGDIISDNDNLWPVLCEKNRMKDCRHKDKSQVYETKEALISGDDSNVINLDNTEYPELGERSSKSKNHIVINKIVCPPGHDIKICMSDDMKVAARSSKAVKKSKRTEQIYINLAEALQNTRGSKKHTSNKGISKFKINIYKTNTSPANTDTSDRSKTMYPKIQRIKICYGKGQKLSKLKKIILMNRNLKARINIQKREAFELAKMDAMSKDIETIDFNALRITTDPEIDIDYVKGMSSLTFYGKDHRRPCEENLTEKTVCLRPDVNKKLSDLRIQAHSVPNKFIHTNNTDQFYCNSETIDEILTQTLSLEINDDDKEDIKPVIEDNKNFVIHSRNFREYCTNMITPRLNQNLEKFLSKITSLQKKQYERNPMKTKYKRRYYSGSKEVRKHVESKKLKLVIIAPDIEKIELEDGLDDQVQKLLEACRKHNVPCCFGLRRRKLGYYVHGKGFVGCVGIANYAGTEDLLMSVLVELVHARNELKKLNGETNSDIDISKSITDDLLLSEAVNALMTILSPAGDSQR